MYILAIETTGPFCSVAIINEKKQLIDSLRATETMSHLSELIPMISQLLNKNNISKKDLNYIACSIGPGSFTGIRIGVATTRALAQTLGCKCIGVSSLEAFMENKNIEKVRETYLNHKKSGAKSAPPKAMVLFNARRGQVYGFMESYIPAGPYMLKEFLEKFEIEALPKINESGEFITIYGDGIDAYETQILESFKAMDFEDYILIPEEFRYQSGEAVAMRGATLLAEADFAVSYEKLKPDYMRMAEAEQKLRAGELPICKGPKQE